MIGIDPRFSMAYEFVKAHQCALRQQAALDRLAAIACSRRASAIARRLALLVRELAGRLRRRWFA